MIGDEVVIMVQNAFVEGEFDTCIYETLIMLISMEAFPIKLSHHRLISLWNVIYKIISKVLLIVLGTYLMMSLVFCRVALSLARYTFENILVA